jgi:predicted permease
MTAPPLWATLVLRRICSAETRAEVEGDMLEAFTAWAASQGLASARRRYWREVVSLARWRLQGAWRRRRDAKAAVPTPGGRAARAPRRGGDGLRNLRQDVRGGLRRFARDPVSSGVAVILLAVGVGGNATVYTVVERLFMQPPPLLSSPRQLMGMDWVMGSGSGVVFGYYDYEFYRENAASFSGVLAYGGFPGSTGRRTDDGGGEVVVGRGETAEQAGTWVVSGNYFQVLGVPMELGSGFSPEVAAGTVGLPEVILSHGYWARAWGEDPSILGRALLLNGVPFRVVGVAPRGFRGVNLGEPVPDLFIPILSADAISSGFRDVLRRFQDDGSPSASRFLRLIARRKPGLTPEQAQAELGLLQERWEREFATWARTVYGETYQVRLRTEFNFAPFESRALKRRLYFMWFFAGAVFLIGCANLATLLLARAAGREREMGIRASLGATQRRLFTQLVTESLVLAVVGGLAGLAVAYVAAGALGATVWNLGSGFTPDGSVVAFAMLLSALAAVFFGTAPAWMLARVDVVTLLQRPGHARTRALFRGGLVVVQTALSVLLLVGGGLLARSVQAVQHVNLGFDPDRRLILSVLLDNQGYKEDDGRTFVVTALDRLRQIPGVRSATVCTRVPFLGGMTWAFTAPGTQYAESGLRTGLNLVGPDYFRTTGIGIVAGREFTGDDGPSSPRVAVVNEVFAQRFWPGASPLGRTLDLAGESWTVVGVAKTSVYYSVTEAPRPFVYFPSLQIYEGRQNFIVSTTPATSTIAGPAVDALREINASLPVTRMTLAGLVDSQIAGFRTWSVLIGILSGIALLLAVVGLYGVQSHLVSTRTREIGIRMAMGANGRSVVGDVLRSGLIMGGTGVLVGVVGALALSRLMRGFVFGVSPVDPMVFTLVPVALLVACAVASLLPAAQASRVDPVEALARE